MASTSFTCEMFSWEMFSKVQVDWIKQHRVINYAMSFPLSGKAQQFPAKKPVIKTPVDDVAKRISNSLRNWSWILNLRQTASREMPSAYAKKAGFRICTPTSFTLFFRRSPRSIFPSFSQHIAQWTNWILITQLTSHEASFFLSKMKLCPATS